MDECGWNTVKRWSTNDIMDAGHVQDWDDHDIALLVCTLEEMWEDSPQMSENPDTAIPPNESRGVRYWGDGLHDDTAAIQAWITMDSSPLTR